jgi:hypothetical protein
MSAFRLTDYEFADVQRIVTSYNMTPLYGKRAAARTLVEAIESIHSGACARHLRETQEELEFKRKETKTGGK